MSIGERGSGFQFEGAAQGQQPDQRTTLSETLCVSGIFPILGSIGIQVSDAKWSDRSIHERCAPAIRGPQKHDAPLRMQPFQTHLGSSAAGEPQL